MRDESFRFLSDLIDAPSPSGFEGPVREVWSSYVGQYADSVRTDLHGNVIATLNEGGAPRIMFAGHCDELGFMVKYIDDDGYLSFATIGGFDTQIIPGRRVVVHAEGGPVPGAVGKKALHLMSPDDRKKVPDVHELWIDIGAKDRKEAESLVSVGDPVTYDVHLERLRGDLVVSRGLDNKMGAFAVGEVSRLLAGASFAPAVSLVSTVQEEIGLRGARTAAYGIDPTVGIAIDVTHATDHPGADKKSAGDVRLGGGPVVTRGANINPVVARLLIESAKAEGMPFQIEGYPGVTGTDAGAIQVTRAGVATGLVSVPLRYMHTPTEVLSTVDLENCAKLLTAFVEAVDEETDFTP